MLPKIVLLPAAIAGVLYAFCEAPAAPNLLPSFGAGQKAVTRVRVQPDSMVLYVGDVSKATCQPLNNKGYVLGNRCNWTLLDANGVIGVAVADSQHAWITGLKVGQARVRTGVSGKADTMLVRIASNVSITVEGIAVKPDQALLVGADSTCKQLLESARWPATDTVPVPACFGPDSLGVVRPMVQQWCAYVLGSDGLYRLVTGQDGLAYCRLQYDKFPATQRGIGYPVAAYAPGSPHVPFTVAIDSVPRPGGRVVYRPRVVRRTG